MTAARLVERLLTPRGLVAAWFTYALANALIRFSFTSTLNTDDAHASFIAQSFQLGYQQLQPPLWEWMLVALQQVLGPGVESHLLLRYGMIALIGIAVYRASLAVSGNVRWSAAVALSYPLAYQLGWPFFEWGTHTLVLTAACLFTLEFALRHVEKPDLKSAAWLGAAIGVGLLTKFVFVLFLTALLLVLAARAETRRGLLHGSTLFGVLVALAITTPYFIWIVQNLFDVDAAVSLKLIAAQDPYPYRVLVGLSRLIVNALGFLAPWFLIVLGLWWAGRREGHVAGPAVLSERVARDTVLCALALAAAGIVLIGASRLPIGYMYALLIAALPYAAGLLSRTGPARGERWLAGLSLLVLLGLIAGRALTLANGGVPPDARHAILWPYESLAQELERRDLARGTIVTFTMRDAGNLRAFLGDARVLLHFLPSDLAITASVKQPAHARTCSAVWQGAIPPSEETGAAPVATLAGRPREAIDVRWPPTLLGERRVSRWLVARLDPDDSLCQ